MIAGLLVWRGRVPPRRIVFALVLDWLVVGLSVAAPLGLAWLAGALPTYVAVVAALGLNRLIVAEPVVDLGLARLAVALSLPLLWG